MIGTNELLALAALIVLSGIFSGSETALVAISRFKVELFIKRERKGANYLKALKENPHKMISTLLIGNNIVNIMASVLATDMALKIFPNNPLAYATGIMTFLILVFGEIVPKSIASTYASRISLFMAPIIYALQVILFPLIIIFDFITTKVFRVKLGKPRITEEEIRNIIDMAKEEGGIDKEEKELIHKIFKFDDIDVDDIKVPRIDMAALEKGSKLKDAIELIKEEQYSRIPIYEESLDKIIGIFYFKDALNYIQKKKYDVPIEKLMRKPLFIPETKKIDETLKMMQKEKQQMAILVDEHGGVSGLITMEQILEEIVGDIQDETEVEEKEIKKINKTTYRILGKADIEDVNKKLKTKLPVVDDYDTISGYILHILGRIPKQGEELEIDGLKMKVEKIEDNRIVEVSVSKK